MLLVRQVWWIKFCDSFRERCRYLYKLEQRLHISNDTYIEQKNMQTIKIYSTINWSWSLLAESSIKWSLWVFNVISTTEFRTRFIGAWCCKYARFDSFPSKRSPEKVLNKLVLENENIAENEPVNRKHGGEKNTERGEGRFLRGGLGRRRLSPAVKGASVC